MSVCVYLTGGGQWGLDFRSGCDGLHWSGLLGRQLLQTDASLLKHLLHRVLLLEDLLDLVLVENQHGSQVHYLFKAALKLSNS